MAKCFDCGNEGPVDMHHVFGRDVDPDTVVPLCPTCHRIHHQGMLLVYNAACQKFDKWYEAQKRYVRREERLQKLEELGYLPFGDGWEKSDLAPMVVIKFLKDGWGANLRQYLRRVGRLDLLNNDGHN